MPTDFRDTLRLISGPAVPAAVPVAGRYAVMASGAEDEVSAAPGLFQKADGTVWLRNPDLTETQVAGGGSQPGAERWTGPWPVSFEDYDSDLGGILIGNLDVAIDDLILDALFIPDVTFTDASSASVSVGQVDVDYESFPPGGFAGGVAAPYGTFGDFLQIVGWAGKPITAQNVKIDPVIVTALPIQMWLAIDSEPSAGSGRVWIKTVTPAAP